MWKILRFVRATFSVVVGAGFVWAGATNRPEVAGRETYVMAIGGAVMLIGLWRMSAAFKDDKKK